MAIEKKIKTNFGETRKCYIRVNNIEANNHGQPTMVLFRAFISEKAFKEGAGFVAEYQFEFTPDVSQPLWTQAYEQAEASGLFDES